MHTYIHRIDTHDWEVCFEAGAGGRRTIRRFEYEIEAAAYASFLNGGVWPGPTVLSQLGEAT